MTHNTTTEPNREPMTESIHGVTPAGNLVLEAPSPDAATAAATIYRLAEQFEAEAEASRRMLGKSGGRCTTADAISRCASIARQFAYQVERRGVERAARRLPQQPALANLDDAARVAQAAVFRCRMGRDPTARELSEMFFEVRAMRTALLAAWPLLRQAVGGGQG